MTERQRRMRPASAARIVVAGTIIVGGALAVAGQAAADPVIYPTPAPGDPAPAGQPVAEGADAPVGPPAPPPVGPPVVPEIPNPQYGSGSGPIGSLRDIYHEVRDGGLDDVTGAGGADGPALAPPPGAGPAPKLPPGYTSLTDPSSSTPALPRDPAATGPALPPGYYPLNGPPPPGYAPAAPPPAAPVDASVPPADAPILPPTP